MARCDFARRAIVRPKPGWLQLVIALAIVAAGAISRYLVDQGAYGVPFATFLPFVVLAAILLDWPFALLAASLGGIAGIGFMTGSSIDLPTSLKATSVIAYSLTIVFLIGFAQLLRQTVIELDRQREQADLLNRELQHRAGNSLQIIKALAAQAAKHSDPAEFYQTLSGRLDALAKANALLGTSRQSTCDMTELVDRVLKPFPQDSFVMRGEPCQIDGDSGLWLTLALHEMATNALKYGALSQEGGSIELVWRCHPDQGVGSLAWRERGGPEVQPPKRFGLGSRILSPNRALRKVDLRYPADGFECDIRFNLS